MRRMMHSILFPVILMGSSIGVRESCAAQSIDINAALTYILKEVQHVDTGLLNAMGYTANATSDVVGSILSNTTNALPSAYTVLQNTTTSLLSSENTLQTVQGHLLTLLSYNMTCEGTVAEGSDSWFTSQDGQNVGLAALVVGSHFMIPAWNNVIKPAAVAIARLAGECWRAARKDPIMRFLEQDPEMPSKTQKSLWTFLHALQKEIDKNSEQNPIYSFTRVRGDGVATDDAFIFTLPGIHLELTRAVGNKGYQSFFTEGQTILNRQDAVAILEEFEAYVKPHLDYDQFTEQLKKMSAKGVMHALNPPDEDSTTEDRMAFEFGTLVRCDLPKGNDDEIVDADEMIETAQFSSRYCLKLTKTPIQAAEPPLPPVVPTVPIRRDALGDELEDNV